MLAEDIERIGFLDGSELTYMEKQIIENNKQRLRMIEQYFCDTHKSYEPVRPNQV